MMTDTLAAFAYVAIIAPVLSAMVALGLLLLGAAAGAPHQPKIAQPTSETERLGG